MSGSLLALCLVRNRLSSTHSLIKSPNAHGFGRGFDSIYPSSSIPSSTWGRLEQFRNMGGGPRTFPGGLSKWQWKRLHEKKARQKEKTLLQQDRQVYLARIRSQLRGKIFENDDDNTSNINVAKQDPSHGPMTPKDQIAALSDRFMKMGAEDLWNEDDGPLTSDPSPPPPAAHGDGAENTAEVHRWNKEKESLKRSVKDSQRKYGSGSILFSRGFTARSGRSMGVDRGRRFSDEEYSGQRRSREFGREQRFSGDNNEYSDKKRSGGIDRDQKFSNDKEEYSDGRRSRGFDRDRKFSDDKEEYSDRRNSRRFDREKISDNKEQSSDGRRSRGFDREGKISDIKEQSSDRRRSRGPAKDQRFCNDFENYIDQRMNRGLSRDKRFDDDIEEFIDQTRNRGFDRDGRLSDNNKEYSGQRNKGIGLDRRFSEEVNDKQQRGQINEEFDGSDGESEQSDARSTAAPKSLIDDEMELDGIIDEEMTIGLKLQNELLNSRDFHEGNNRDFRGPKHGRMGQSRSKRRSLVDSDEDDDDNDDQGGFRNSKAGRNGGHVSAFSGRNGESRSKRRWSVDSVMEDDQGGFRSPKVGRFGGPVSSFSGRKGESRSKRRSLVDSDEEVGFRNTKAGRFGASGPVFSGSNLKRQSMRGLDKAGEREFGWAGAGRRGRSLSYYTGSKRKILRNIDVDQKTEFRLKISRMEDSMPISSSLSLKTELFTGSDEEEVDARFRQPRDEAGMPGFSLRSKRQVPRDMENDGDEEKNSDKELIPAEFSKKEEPKHRGFNMDNRHPWNGEEESYLSRSMCVAGRTCLQTQ